MDEQRLKKQVEQAIVVRREDITRAKQFILRDKGSGTDGIVNRWFTGTKVSSPDLLVFPSPELEAGVEQTAREFSLRLAMYQAVWELISTGEVIPVAQVKEWVPEYGFRNHNHTSGYRLDNHKAYYIPEIHRLPRIESLPVDADVFLEGVEVASLHPGIRSGVEQALDCFRRGLYLPAVAMLGAAVEATWTECGEAVAKNLGVSKLEATVQDPMTGIGKKVGEIRKALETEQGRALLKAAERTVNNLAEAEQWTSVLRDKRNALHWGKAGSFVADHASTASLLMGAPMHIGTLEAVRAAC